MTPAAPTLTDPACLNWLRRELCRKAGFDVASVGEKVFERAVRLQMRGLGLSEAEEYRELIERSPGYWTELLESVLVTETWFFRDPEVFRAFARLVAEEWMPQNTGRPVRILSLACSSGEEPFSAVMALLEAGLAASRFHVDALDICRPPIAFARRAVYGSNSFRGRNLDFRDRYFSAHGAQEFALHPQVQDQVRFYEGNLIAEDFPLGQDSYDFIFCRNLLIYVDAAAQRKALEKVEQLLAPSGMLFVGPAEQAIVRSLGFEASQSPRAFRRPTPKSVTGDAGAVRPARATDWPGTYSPMAIETHRKGAARQAECPAFLPREKSGTPTANLEEVRRLGDAGRLAEAAAACEEHLRLCRACPEGHYLMGLLREAQGDTRAFDSFRRALYLQPNYYEVLSHMALLSEQNGDLAAAKNFRRRAERNQPTPPVP